MKGWSLTGFLYIPPLGGYNILDYAPKNGGGAAKAAYHKGVVL
jgi:hypothetical protein